MVSSRWEMEGVAKALLSKLILIFLKGVPLIFVNDEAIEFVDVSSTA
jgi:hypothetical protein